MKKSLNQLTLAFMATVLLLVSGCEQDPVDPTDAIASEESPSEGTLVFLDDEEDFAENSTSNAKLGTPYANTSFNAFNTSHNSKRRLYIGWGQSYNCTTPGKVGPMQTPSGDRLQAFKYHYKAEVRVRANGSANLKVFPTVHLDGNCNPTKANRSFVAYLSVEKKSKSGKWVVQYSGGNPSYKSTSWKTGAGKTGTREVGAIYDFEQRTGNPVIIPDNAIDVICTPNFSRDSNGTLIRVSETCSYTRYFPGIFTDVVVPAPVKEVDISFSQWGSGTYRVKAIVTTQGKEKRLTSTFSYTK